MTCPACDQSVDNGIKCKECKIWLHYYCTKLPDYYLVLLKTKQNLTFYCETCCVGKCPQFVTDQAKIKSAIESQRLARSGIPEDSDKQSTPPGSTNSNIKDVHDNHPWAPAGIFPGGGAKLWGGPQKICEGGPHIFLDKL